MLGGERLGEVDAPNPRGKVIGGRVCPLERLIDLDITMRRIITGSRNVGRDDSLDHHHHHPEEVIPGPRSFGDDLISLFICFFLFVCIFFMYMFL